MSFTRYAENIFLNCLSHYLPERTVTNEDLVRWMGKNIRPSWIEKRTGIKERHWVDANQSCSDLATMVSQSVLEKYADFDRLGYLILSTISGDFLTPPTAPLVQNRLGLEGIGSFDMGAACSGFVTALHVSGHLCAPEQSVLLVSAEIRSKFLNPEDFATAALFGDGSAACVVSRKPKSSCFRLIASQLFSDGSVGDVIAIPSGGSVSPATVEVDTSKFFLKMKDGAEIFLKAVEGMREAGAHFLDKTNTKIEDIQWMVPHQANGHLIAALADRMGFPIERVVNVIAQTGNTSGSTVGVALSHLLEREGALQNKDKILLIAAGGGGLASCALLEFQKETP
jgi:3-oxoacyl-[acyl-carrier-protein] synthase-3